MFFRQIADESLAQYAYMIGCERSGEAIVIDPERDVDRYIAIAEANRLRIVAAAETHIHADFLSGVREFAERIGAHAYVSGAGGPDWSPRWLDKKAGGGVYAHTLLRDGDTIEIGAVTITARHTPGHTPEHISYIVTDRDAGTDSPVGIVTGDFVFVGDLGRPDLLDTSAGMKDTRFAAADRLRESAAGFLTFDDFTMVWPGHGAGSACGKALGAVPQSSVGYERRTNRALSLVGEAGEFRRFILDEQPEPPMYFGRMKVLNRDGAPVLGALPDPPIVDWREAVRAGSEGTSVVIDTRPPGRHRAGAAPGGYSAAISNSFTNTVGSFVEPTDEILLVSTSLAERDEAVRRLVRIGLDRVTGWIDEASLAAAGDSLECARAVTVAELPGFVEAGGRVLDVRLVNELGEGEIPGSERKPYTRSKEWIGSVDVLAPIAVVCRTGVRSEAIASMLRRRGADARSLDGGIVAWNAAGKRHGV